MLLLASAGSALAGGQPGSLGVGAEVGLNGLTGGASLNYDTGQFHVGGFLRFEDGGGDDDTDISLGGRFYWHIHSTAMADFGIGGGLGFLSVDNGPDVDRSSLLFFEPGFQIRAFVASNVALSFTGGFSIGLVDTEGALIDGQLTAGAGVHYYFF